ncbi:hypothetical protein SO802_001603 [Lithocarpus litseifolius]|uniref:RNase H type-1 domain-containing protein n=1 Tax=Lithocarpus litseifolius TaxID=425828 RepID=A0AAW2DWR9_9ROSI
MVVTQALKSKEMGLTAYGLLIRDALSLAGNFSEVSYSHTKREGNNVAHGLAKLAASLTEPKSCNWVLRFGRKRGALVEIMSSPSLRKNISSNKLNTDQTCKEEEELAHLASDIFRALTILLRLNEKAYVLDAFSIGPFHHGHPKFQAMEAIKKEMLRNLIMSINDVEREVHECYAKPLKYSPDEFVKILVVDGCFIIELFSKDANEKLRGVDDPIFTMLSMHQFLYHDLILLENQIPWMVLEHLFNLTEDPTHDKPLTLIELAREFFVDFFLTKLASSYPPI